ncbi:MAG: roadblock/LC7 domain-containing protein [Promethearchaeota archaeon]|jgi:predicted regulator of Ras-like GTPase activity (Roadblock/LC7/MglB family)
MNSPPKSNNSEKREISILLDELKGKGKFKGIIFASRNGEIISENIGKTVDCKKLTSMCASVFESAVGLGETMGDQKIVKIIAELEKTLILMVELEEKKAFLIFIVNEQTDSSFIYDEMEDDIKKIGLLI